MWRVSACSDELVISLSCPLESSPHRVHSSASFITSSGVSRVQAVSITSSFFCETARGGVQLADHVRFSGAKVFAHFP